MKFNRQHLFYIIVYRLLQKNSHYVATVSLKSQLYIKVQVIWESK